MRRPAGVRFSFAIEASIANPNQTTGWRLFSCWRVWQGVISDEAGSLKA
jgi:hypothetical protein